LRKTTKKVVKAIAKTHKIRKIKKL